MKLGQENYDGEMSKFETLGDQFKNISRSVDQNKLQLMDREVSNYLEEIVKDQDIRDIHIEDQNNYENADFQIVPHSGQRHFNNNYNKFNFQLSNQENDIEQLYRKIMEIETVNGHLSDENQKLSSKLNDYLKLNREWEGKVHSIKNVLQDLEEKNYNYKEDNEKLRDEIDQLNFTLSILQEKEKNHEINYKNLKDLQNQYDTRTEDLKKDYRLKEENLKKKYEKLEESVNSKLREQEEEYQDKICKLSSQIKEFQKANLKHVKDLEDYREKLQESERFFKIKEEEFEDIVSSKDRKLKELEMCIKSISDEASNQINKLSDSVSEFNEKINLYKLKESQMQVEYNELIIQNQMLLKKVEENNNQEMKSFDAGNNTSSNERRNTVNTVELINESQKSKVIDSLRNRIKDLEDENLCLSRELNLKYEECDTINEELRMAYESIRNSEMEAQNMLRGKEDEVFALTNKINEMDIILTKYGQNLLNIKKSYEKINNDHQLEIMKKNNEIKQIKENYEKRIKDLQNKIEEVLLKENVFTNKINYKLENSNNIFQALNSVSNNNVLNRVQTSSNPYVYVPKQIPDDEDVRRNINEQINFIKDKLDRSYFQKN